MKIKIDNKIYSMHHFDSNFRILYDLIYIINDTTIWEVEQKVWDVQQSLQTYVCLK